jgi:hypothetical protein
MKAIEFDFNTRELVLSNGKTNITNNPSVQNGMIILNTKCVNVLSPILGIGFNPINSQADVVVEQLNRWKKQCKQEGAKESTFSLGEFDNKTQTYPISTKIIY